MKNTVANPSTSTPSLRFTGFTGEWSEKTLGELSLAGFSNGVFNDPSKVGTGYKLINVKDMYSGEKIKIDRLTLVELSKSVFEKNKAKNGDVFFTRSSLVKEGIAYSNVLTEDDGYITFDGHIIKMSPNHELVDSIFLSKILKTHKLRRQLVARGKTGTMTTIGQEDISSAKVTLPSLTEQKKIASFLSSVDSWLDNLQSQKSSLESCKKSMMQKIFTQDIRFKDENGKDYPEWEEKKISQLGKIFNGLTGKSAEDFGAGEPFITYKQIFDNSEVDSNFGLVKITANERQNRAKFGDIFFTTSSETPEEVGFASVLFNREVAPYLNSFSFGFRANSLLQLDPYYAKYFFRSKIYRREVVKLAQGSTRYNISKVGFMKITVNVPNLLEQKKIADLLTSIDKSIKSKEREIREVELWKKGLMQRMFT